LEWPYSSPMRIMGMPCDSSRAAARLRICRARSRLTLEMSVSPSTPQFQLRLWFSPSLQQSSAFSDGLTKQPHQLSSFRRPKTAALGYMQLFNVWR
jgi:hypothetical protein